MIVMKEKGEAEEEEKIPVCVFPKHKLL